MNPSASVESVYSIHAFPFEHGVSSTETHIVIMPSVRNVAVFGDGLSFGPRGLKDRRLELAQGFDIAY